MRYLELESQISQPFKHRVKFPLIAVGVFFFVVGICKKTLIADPLGFYFTDPVFAAAERGDELSFITAWIGTISFSLQIYFDFSGYTDMALGLASIFGFVLPVNFNAPYKSTSIIEFWRRWHMTLSRFLRDYLYVPLGGNQNGLIIQILAITITMFLGGLWHGASWLFVFWGIFHGLMLIINHLYRKATPNQNSSFLLCCLYWFFTMLGICIAWVFFRAQTFDGAISMIIQMLLLNGVSLPVELSAILSSYFSENFIEAFSITFVGHLPFDILGATITIPVVVAIVLLLPTSQVLGNTLKNFMCQTKSQGQFAPIASAFFCLGVFAVGFLFVYAALRTSAPQEFIYFDF